MATNIVSQIFQDAWDDLWSAVATSVPLLHFTTGNGDEWHTALDPLILQNPTTGVMKYGAEFGDHCKCHHWEVFSVCVDGLFQAGLTDIRGISKLTLDTDKLNIKLACGSGAAQKALLITAPFSGDIQMHAALQGRFGSGVPYVGCHNINITAAPNVRIAGTAQFMVPLAPSASPVTIGSASYVGTQLVLSAASVTVSQLFFDPAGVDGIINYLLDDVFEKVPVVGPALARILEKTFAGTFDGLTKKWSGFVSKEINSFVAPIFRKPIRTRLSSSYDKTLGIPFQWICAAAQPGGNISAALTPQAAAFMDIETLAPGAWPCIPSTVDQSPDSFNAGSVDMTAFLLQNTCGSDQICAACGTQFGSQCPTMPGTCVTAACDPLCNTAGNGQCCGSGQVCINRGPAGACCTPLCKPCMSGSDGCGGTCVASCTDPAQHCGSGSLEGQCVNNIGVASFSATDSTVVKAVSHRKYGPLFINFNAQGDSNYAGGVTLAPLTSPGVPFLPGTTIPSLVLPTYFLFTPATPPWATPYVVVPNAAAAAGDVSMPSPMALCADTTARQTNSTNITLPVVVAPTPYAQFVQFDVRPLVANVPVPAGAAPYCYLLATIPGDPASYTLSYVGISNMVMLVQGPATTSGVITDPSQGNFVSTLWQLGGCNVDADCGTAAGPGTCMGNMCFPGSGGTYSYDASSGAVNATNGLGGTLRSRAADAAANAATAMSASASASCSGNTALQSPWMIAVIAIAGALVLAAIITGIVMARKARRQ